ncbi:uncharacterized protein MCYG_07851 [Microsporum canis CBS 113480]|uniref:Uncharacterized protein n=1 Tax=Arthroderma otae (strain ATCC MYA-4605 / CBS 113480) TaxID=554155 RepID=C5FXJ2_ARTOC|nr:uncharacterized protein MCYG_07851 [Microsporum canis CBS 113480]EEQ35032.1 predicted protein [Microsporum canis CBS 113480]
MQDILRPKEHRTWSSGSCEQNLVSAEYWAATTKSASLNIISTPEQTGEDVAKTTKIYGEVAQNVPRVVALYYVWTPSAAPGLKLCEKKGVRCEHPEGTTFCPFKVSRDPREARGTREVLLLPLFERWSKKLSYHLSGLATPQACLIQNLHHGEAIDLALCPTLCSLPMLWDTLDRETIRGEAMNNLSLAYVGLFSPLGLAATRRQS